MWRAELFVRRERTVGGKHGHAGRATLPPDFAKCGGGRRVVEAPPGRRLPQLVRRRDGGSPYGRAGARPSPVRRQDGGFPSCCAAWMAALNAAVAG